MRKSEKLKMVAKKYGFSYLEDPHSIYLRAETTNNQVVNWLYLTKRENLVSILGDTDDLNIWLYKTRPGLTDLAIINFVIELNEVLEPDQPISLRDLVAAEDWQEIAGVSDASEDKRWENRYYIFSKYCSDNPADKTVSIYEMYAYGYAWKGMLPLREEKALELFGDITIFKLYPDDTESEVLTVNEIYTHDGLFGVHEVDWNQYTASHKEEDLETLKRSLAGSIFNLPNVCSIEFDGSALEDQVIFLIKYDIPLKDDMLGFFKTRTSLIQSVLTTAETFGLKPSGDRIEDYGEYLYFVMNMK